MKSITGSVKKILELEEKGSNKFPVQEVIITTNDKKNPNVKLTFLGDNTDFVNKLQEGYVFEFMLNVFCNEYNGKYYNNINCWGVKQLNPEAPAKEEKGFVPEEAKELSLENFDKQFGTNLSDLPF